MLYRYIAVNVLGDALGHRIEIRGRTQVGFTFEGRETLISSEVLTENAIAIYRSDSRLVEKGSGESILTDAEIDATIAEIGRALQDVGTTIEIV